MTEMEPQCTYTFSCQAVALTLVRVLELRQAKNILPNIDRLSLNAIMNVIIS